MKKRVININFKGRSIAQAKATPFIIWVVVCVVSIVSIVYLHIPQFQHFSLNIGEGNDTSIWEDIFIDASYIGQSYKDGQETYRKFIGANTRAYINLKNRLSGKQDIELTATVRSDEDLDAYMSCDLCDTDLKWNQNRDYNPTFYKTQFKDYAEIGNYSGIHIYARNDIVDTTDFSRRAGDIHSWIEDNMKEGSYSASIIDADIDLSSHLSTQEIDTTLLTVPTLTRGDVTYIAYFKDSIDLTIKKADLNWYTGKEDVEVTITPMGNPDEVLSNFVILDDDNTSDDRMRGENQEMNIQLQDIEEGSYEIHIREVRKENAVPQLDFVVPEVIVNTNKIVLTGEVVFGGRARLYYNSSRKRSIRTLIWTEYQLQDMWSDVATVYNADYYDINKWNTIQLQSGNRKFRTEDSIRIDMNDYFFAFSSNDSYYNPYVFEVNSNNPDIIITSLDFSFDNGWATVSKTIPVESVIDHYNITGSQLSDVGQLEWQLLAPNTGTAYTFINQLVQQGYYYAYNDGSVHIFTKRATKNISDVFYKSYFEWLEDNVPKYSAVGTINFEPNYRKFSEHKNWTTDDNQTTIDVEFYGGAKLQSLNQDSIDISLEYIVHQEPLSLIRFQIYNSSGEVIADETIADENIAVGSLQQHQISIPNIKNDVYTLDFLPSNVDYSIVECTINSDNVVFTGPAFFQEESQIYLEHEKGRTVKYKLERDEDQQVLSINDDPIVLTQESVGSWLYQYLPHGAHTISTREPVWFDADYYSISEDSFFIPFQYTFEAHDDQNYVIYDQEIPTIYLSSIEVTVE